MRLRLRSFAWVVQVLLFVSASGAWAQPGPQSGVAFASNRTGANNIYVMNPDGSDQIPLTLDGNNNQRPDISPDGGHIVFASNRASGTTTTHFEIFVMNSDGSDVRRLTTTGMTFTNTWPRWSPDGEWIAFQSNVSGAFQIYAVRPDGSDMRQVTNTGVNQFPAWSPDGTHLAVRRDADIYVIDIARQSDPLRLTTTGPLNQMPAWSPDGTKIAFMSTREVGNYPSVFLMNADGSNQIDLTPKLDSGKGTWSSRAPAWSPNGAFIYFTGIRPDLLAENIYVMRVDGSDQTALTGLGVNAEATVRHVRPPTITDIAATPNVLWPPNNQMVNVSVAIGVADDSDPSPVCRITDVASNEPIDGTAWSFTGPLTLTLLAQRFGAGTGRVYTLRIGCTNSSALTSTATVAVIVPHDQRK